MVIGMSLEHFTLLHVVISLAGIMSGFVVTYGLLGGKRLDLWTAFFLVTTILTSATGYLFQFHELLPSHIVGAISLLILPLAVFARYVRRLAGSWRRTYVLSAMIALYLNVFVLIVQVFLKIPALKEIAPTGTEAPFKLAQLLVLAVFVLLAVLADRKFRPAITGLHTSVAFFRRDGAD